jgi:hypothetical protein
MLLSGEPTYRLQFWALLQHEEARETIRTTCKTIRIVWTFLLRMDEEAIIDFCL